MGTRRTWKSRRIFSWWPWLTVSASMRRISASGNRACSSSSARWVPTPMCFMAPPHSGQASLLLLGIAAVVAHHPPVGGVIGQMHAAPGALGHIAALGAQQLPAAAPAVEKQDALLPGLQILLQLPGQLPADAAGVAVPQLPAAYPPGSPGAVPVGVVAPPQQRQLIVPPAGVIRRLHRGGGRTQQAAGHFPGNSGIWRYPLRDSRGDFRIRRSSPAPRPG